MKPEEKIWEAAKEERRLRRKKTKRNWYEKNKEKHREITRVWQKANPEKVKDSQQKIRLKRYGLTLKQRDAMLIEQENRCPICKTDAPGKSGWHVDHCHKTGETRSLLCGRCNPALGFVKDDTETLRNMITYLEKHSSKSNQERLPMEVFVPLSFGG